MKNAKWSKQALSVLVVGIDVPIDSKIPIMISWDSYNDFINLENLQAWSLWIIPSGKVACVYLYECSCTYVSMHLYPKKEYLIWMFMFFFEILDVAVYSCEYGVPMSGGLFEKKFSLKLMRYLCDSSFTNLIP